MLNKTTYRTLKRDIAIKESYEKLIEIPSEFLKFSSHPYQNLGAPYGEQSPYFLRSGVIELLYFAQKRLETLQRGYRLKIFDAYRPLSVQKFMIEYDTNRVAYEKFGTTLGLLLEVQKEEVRSLVLHFWSPITEDVQLNPPPHATGGALDLSIVDANGIALDMGTDIDELKDASESNYYNGSGTLYEKNRALLVEVMEYAGFTQLPTEWWHFSYGDQTWALQQTLQRGVEVDAKYGLL